MKALLTIPVLLFALMGAAHAQDYQAPTRIAMTIEQRQQLIEQAQHSDDPEKQRSAWLAELANITATNSKDEQRIETLIQQLSQALTQAPNDAELMAALGSLYSYQSSLHTDNLAKLNILMRKGTRYMDRAIKLSPNHLGARLQRGLACANMPAFVKRAHFAIQDLTLVRDQVGQQYGPDFQAFVEFYLAQALLRDGQPNAARDMWHNASQHPTSWGKKSEQVLAEL